MKTCLVIGASPECFWDNSVTPDYVVCADGGFDNAKKLGLKVDMIIGDFDSIESADIFSRCILLPKEKDLTDLEACVRYGLAEGCDNFILTGCTGGRLDHFLSGIGILEFIIDRYETVTAKIINKDNEIFVFNDSFEIRPPHKRKYFSVIPLDRDITHVKIVNAKYTLDKNVVYRAGGSLTVSNEPLPGQTVIISMQGRAVAVLSD